MTYIHSKFSSQHQNKAKSSPDMAWETKGGKGRQRKDKGRQSKIISTQHSDTPWETRGDKGRKSSWPSIVSMQEFRNLAKLFGGKSTSSFEEPPPETGDRRSLGSPDHRSASRARASAARSAWAAWVGRASSRFSRGETGRDRRGEGETR